MDRAGWCSHCQWRPPLLYSSIILYAQNEKPNPTPPKQKYYKKKRKLKKLFQISKTQKIPSKTLLSLFFYTPHLQIQTSMSSNNPNQTIRSPEKPESKFEDEAEDEEEAEELEQLETQVKQMAKKILEYRATLPDQLKTTLALLLSSQRPILPDCDSGSDPGPSGELNPG